MKSGRGASSPLPDDLHAGSIEGKPLLRVCLMRPKSCGIMPKTKETRGMNPENEKLASILAEAETIAVVGLSDDPARTSHRIAAYMQEAGYRIIPINPGIDSALGEKAYPSLGAFTERIDIVNVFRRSEEIPTLVDGAIKIHPRAFWMQKGIAHSASALRLEDAGITTIQDLCIKTTHRELTQSLR